jgi:uncharacterized protein YwbE
LFRRPKLTLSCNAEGKEGRIRMNYMRYEMCGKATGCNTGVLSNTVVQNYLTESSLQPYCVKIILILSGFLCVNQWIIN